MASIYTRKLASLDDLRQKLDNMQEPKLSYLAKILVENLRSRPPPVVLATDKVRVPGFVRRVASTDFARILLKNLHHALLFLIHEPIHRIASLPPNQNPFPEKEYECPGVYMIQYLHSDNTPLTVEDAVKLANLLSNKRRLERVLGGAKDKSAGGAKNKSALGRRTAKACGLIGAVMTKVLQEMDCWLELVDPEAEEEEGDIIKFIATTPQDSDVDYEEEDEEEEEEDEDEEDDEEEAAEDSDDEEFLPPSSLSQTSVMSELFDDPKFQQPYPYCPVYVGYSKQPLKRWKSHKKRMVIADTALIVVVTPPPKGIHSNVHVWNLLCASLFDETEVGPHLTVLYSSWDNDFEDGTVHHRKRLSDS